jgi:hypothetical protein
MATKNSWIKRKERYGLTGSKNPEMTKQKRSRAHKELYKKGFINPNRGKHWKQKEEQIVMKSGKNSSSWKGGKTDPRKKIRNSQNLT